MKNYFNILFLFLFAQASYAQDVAITANVTPVSGCKLTSGEIKVVIFNKKPSSTVTEIIPSYTIDGGSPVVGATIGVLSGGASSNYTFSQPVDLSECDHDFNIVVSVNLTYGTDEDPSDNTLAWTVRNDCDVVVGQIDSDVTVCEDDNTGTLVLNGWQYGTLLNWVYSEDGTTWSPIPGTAGSTSYTFDDLTATTQVKIKYDGGYCGLFETQITTVTVQPKPDAVTLDGPDSLCISNASDQLNLTGNTSPVLDWESSVDSVNWNSLVNTTDSYNFSSLSQTTMYRVLIDGEICPNVYSDTFTVVVSDLSIAGMLNPDTVLCESGSLDVVLASFSGDITGWESSNDGNSWVPNGQINDTLNTGILTSSTYYRTIVKNGACPNDTSNQVFIDIQPKPTAVTIAGGGSFCESNANGALTLSVNSGNVIKWESSIDEGLNWSNISNTSTTENFSNLSQSTWYRAFIDGGVCADIYTDTAIILVSPVSVAGILSEDATICQGGSDSLYLMGNTGDVVSWEYSNDGITWIPLNTNDSSYIIAPVMDSKYYKVIVKNDVCEEDTSNIVFVDAIPAPVADAGSNVSIFPGDSVQLQGSGGIVGLWTPNATLSDSTIYDPFAFPTSTTSYTLYVMNAEGCFDSDMVTVAVGGSLSQLDVKNVITANGDGFNDTWFIEGAEYFPNIEVKVYNIYGNLVYENADYKNDWTGDYKGKMLPDGTYLYIVMPGGTDTILKGNLTIIGGHE